MWRVRGRGKQAHHIQPSEIQLSHELELEKLLCKSTQLLVGLNLPNTRRNNERSKK